MIQQAVILAAGRGSRLGELTHTRTKAMLPVLGKPMMVRVMDRIREAGITRFVVVIGPEEGSLADYLNSSWYPDTKVEFVLQPFPKGTADALALATKYIETDFLLTSVDNLMSPELIPLLLKRYRDMQADFILSLIRATPDEISASSEVVIEGERITRIIEKPQNPTSQLAAFMVYACGRKFLDYLANVKASARGERELAVAVQNLIDDGGKVGYVIGDYRHHLTFDSDYLAINKILLDEGRDAHILSELPGTVAVIPPIRIDPGVRVRNGAQIGPYVYLESGSTVGEKSRVANSIVLQNAVLRDGEICENQIVTSNLRIPVKGA